MAHEDLTGWDIKRLDTCISGAKKQPGRPACSRLWQRLPRELQNSLKFATTEPAYNEAFERIREWFASHPNPERVIAEVPLDKRMHDARCQIGVLRVCAEQIDALWRAATLEQKIIGVQAILTADASAFSAQ